MRRRIVRRIAKLAEVDLKGLQIKIVKGTKGTGFKGYTRSRKCIELYEDAFESAGELANTLGHECCHIADLREAGTNRFATRYKLLSPKEKQELQGKKLNVDISRIAEKHQTSTLEEKK